MRRRLARELAIQTLYFLEMNETASMTAIDYVIDEIRDHDEGQMLLAKDEIDSAYITSLVSGTRKHATVFDEVLAEYLQSWRFDRLSKVDSQVLRLALFELLFAEDVPRAAVLNEAVELAKRFGTEESGKFVNGVMGKVLLDLEQIRERFRGDIDVGANH